MAIGFADASKPPATVVDIDISCEPSNEADPVTSPDRDMFLAVANCTACVADDATPSIPEATLKLPPTSTFPLKLWKLVVI